MLANKYFEEFEEWFQKYHGYQPIRLVQDKITDEYAWPFDNGSWKTWLFFNYGDVYLKRFGSDEARRAI